MLPIILIAGALVAVTVAVHAAGLAVLLRVVMRTHLRSSTRIGSVVGLLIGLAWWLILIHLAEISVWGVFYWWQGCMPDAESAFYFAGVTYTTVGYGDLMLPKPWRLLGPIEGLTGILMCGLSASLFFVAVSTMYEARGRARQSEPVP